MGRGSVLRLGIACVVACLAACGGSGDGGNAAAPLATASLGDAAAPAGGAASAHNADGQAKSSPTPVDPAAAMAGDGSTLSTTPYAGTSATGRTLPGDIAGASDHPVVPRYEGSTIRAYDQKAYDQVRFLVRAIPAGGEKDAVAVGEGRVTDVSYEAPAGRSALEVFRNYQKLLADSGFKTVFACELDACRGAPERIATLIHRRANSFGEQRYVSAYRQSDGLRVAVAVVALSQRDARVPYEIVVVEPKAIEQKISVVSAQGIARDVASSGRAILYAVEFDLDKATLRPTADAQLKEIAGWLATGNGRALVVGHTDAKGGYAYNVGLSQRRAQSVVDALTTRFGIDKARLTAVGVGMAAPVTTNRTEAGAAKNRRVEIVETP